MILAIAREYGQPPAWWDGLSRDDQVLLLGEYRLRCDETERAVNAAKSRNAPGQGRSSRRR